MKPHYRAYLMTKKPSRTHKTPSVSGTCYADVEGAAWDLFASGRPELVGVVIRLVRGKGIEPIDVQVFTLAEGRSR